MLYQDVSLKKYNTFGIDVNTKYLYVYTSVEELTDFLSATPEKNIRYLFLGGGSNVLFTTNFDGVILHSQIKGIEITQNGTDVYVRSGAAVVWDDLVARCVENNLYGIENLSLIPGFVGASPVQNIGAYGVEVKDVIEMVEAIEYTTGKKRTFANSECCFGYRDSIFKNELKNKYIITHVTFKLSINERFTLNYGNIQAAMNAKNIPVTLQSVRDTIIEIRNSKLPDHTKTGNAGSFFKNPVVSEDLFGQLANDFPEIPSYESHNGVKIPAAWLIEQCGLKGAKRGDAAVHTLQPLVIINTGNAKASDIVGLSRLVIDSVESKFGIRLEPEVNII